MIGHRSRTVAPLAGTRVAPASGPAMPARAALAVLLGTAFLLSACSSAAAPAAARVDIPPVGVIWFGSSFDPQTFAISSRLTTVTAHQAFSFVAHLPGVMEATKLAIRTSFNDQLVATTPVNATGSGDLWGFSPGPLFAAGEWKYDLTDIGGNILATGTLTATP